MMGLLNKGHTIVASTVWGLLRSYAAFMPADHPLLLSFLSHLCAAMPDTASSQVVVPHIQADLPAWEIAAHALQTQLSAVEGMVAGIAAAALAECDPAALDAAGNAGLLLAASLLRPMFPLQGDAVSALTDSIDMSVLAREIGPMQGALQACKLLHVPNLRQHDACQRLERSLAVTAEDLRRCAPALLPTFVSATVNICTGYTVMQADTLPMSLTMGKNVCV